MGAEMDEAKGRIKEAAGDLTDDKDLQREGKADQAGAKVKAVIKDVKDGADSVVDKVKDALSSDK